MAKQAKRFQVRRWDTFWNDWTMIPVDFTSETEAERYAENQTILNGIDSDVNPCDITEEYQVWALSLDGFYAVCRRTYWLEDYDGTGKLVLEHEDIF